jgi:hypothetical protein
MDTVELARQILVRHREPGYLRFELPAAICHEPALAALDAALRRVAGVYRVITYGADRRLVVWFDRHACPAADVARALKAALPSLPAAPVDFEAPAAPADTASVSGLPPAVEALGRVGLGLFRSLRDALIPAAPPVAAAAAPDAAASTAVTPTAVDAVRARLQPVLSGALSEKAVINFLNDVLAFYLIKVHWELISKRWLQDPVKHANAWLTVFYLVFLLVRYRKSMNKPTAEPAPPATEAA